MNAPLRPATRFDWQRSLEKSIVAFNPDANEAMELLDALTASLEDRYDRGQLSDVEHEAKQLRDALDELDRGCCSLSPEDEAYEEYLASHDEPE